MGAALDNFDDRYLGTMADTKAAVSSVTPTITTTNGSADVTVSSATGIIVGMKLTSTNIPAGTNVIGISGTTVSLNNAATAAASGTASTFSAHGVFGAFNTSTDGPSTDNDVDSLITGSLYYNTTDNEMRVYDGANWIAASAAGSASMNIFEYTVSGSAATTFSGTDDNGATLSYTQQNIQVVKDGVVLHADDFTATNGTSVVLASSAAVGSEIVIYAFKSFTVADTVSKSSGGTFTGNVTMGGTLSVTGGLTADAGLSVDNITIDGTEIDLSSGDLTVDVAGNIKLDADGGDVRLLDGGTQFGVLQNNSSDFVIQSSVSAKDLIFKGNDSGGSAVTALTLDMSAGGAATLANGLTLSDGNIALASGHGIDFSANSNQSGMTSELLDQYEEGTWTPDIRNADNANTFTTKSGRYTRIGRFVCLTFMNDHGNTGGGGSVQVRNIPFAASAHFGAAGLAAVNGGSLSNRQYNVTINNGQTTFHIYNGGSVDSQTFTYISGFICYFTS